MIRGGGRGGAEPPGIRTIKIRTKKRERNSHNKNGIINQQHFTNRRKRSNSINNSSRRTLMEAKKTNQNHHVGANGGSSERRISNIILLQYIVFFLINVSLLVVTYFSRFYLFILAIAWLSVLLDYVEKKSVFLYSITQGKGKKKSSSLQDGSIPISRRKRKGAPMQIFITLTLSNSRWIIIAFFAYSFLPFHFPENGNNEYRHGDSSITQKYHMIEEEQEEESKLSQKMTGDKADGLNQHGRQDGPSSPSAIKEFRHDSEFGPIQSLNVEIFPFVFPVFISAISAISALISDVFKIFRYNKIGTLVTKTGEDGNKQVYYSCASESNSIGDIMCGMGPSDHENQKLNYEEEYGLGSAEGSGRKGGIKIEIYLCILSVILILVPSVDNNIFTSPLLLTVYKLITFNLCVFFMSKALYLKKDVESKIISSTAKIKSNQYNGSYIDDADIYGDEGDYGNIGGGGYGVLNPVHHYMMEELYFILGYVWILWASGGSVFLSFIQVVISIHCFVKARSKHRDWITKGMKDDGTQQLYEDKKRVPSYDAPRSIERRKIKNNNILQQQQQYEESEHGVQFDDQVDIERGGTTIIHDDDHHLRQLPNQSPNIIYSGGGGVDIGMVAPGNATTKTKINNNNRNNRNFYMNHQDPTSSTSSYSPTAQLRRSTPPPNSLSPPSSGGGGGVGYKKKVKVVKVRPAKKRT